MPRSTYKSFASSKAVQDRMKRQPRKDTTCEMAIRSALHQMGLRYRLHQKPVDGCRIEADLVFKKAKVAVFIDGCFWHGCPLHFRLPKTNTAWWEEKINKNIVRDKETTATYRQAGWTVVRIWEHDSPAEAAEKICKIVHGEALQR